MSNTNDFQRLGVLIKEFGEKKNPHNKELTAALSFYKIVLAYNTQQFEKAKALLKDLSPNTFADDIALRSIMIEIMVSENRLNEALSEIEKTESRFGNLQDLLLLRSRIINLREGANNAQEYLEEQLSDYPYMWKLKLDLLFQKLSAEKIDDKSNAVNSILKIGHNVQNDHSTFLYICNSLFDFGYQAEASILFNTFNQKFSSPNDFMLSNLFLAKFHFVTKDVKRFKDSYNEALKQSPHNLELLWFTYGMMREKGMIDEAEGTLKNILIWDPFDVIVLDELIEVNILLERWENVIKYYSIMLDSGRFIYQARRGALKQYYQKAVSMKK
jgi:tetratricopeptide (TPR) repeat protein